MYTDEFGVQFTDDKKILLHVPKDFKGAYIIPEGTTVLGTGALDGCECITALTIPDSMHVVQASVNDCISLENIYVSENNSVYQAIDGVLFSKDILVRYPIAKQQSTYMIPEGTGLILNGAFAYCCNLQSIHIPDTVKIVLDAAFEGCDNLESIIVLKGTKERFIQIFKDADNEQSIDRITEEND